MKQALLSIRLLAALTMMVGFAVFQTGGSAVAQGQDRVLVCNTASGLVVEVSQAAIDQGEAGVGFPFILADEGAAVGDECSGSTDGGTTDGGTTDTGTTGTDTGTTDTGTTGTDTGTTDTGTTDGDNPSDTGTIKIIKRFCEEDVSQSPNSNCTGRVEVVEGTTVTFTVTDENDDVVDTIDVVIENQGNSSQGQASGVELEAGAEFRVCEDPVDGFVAVPRPGPQGGANQTVVEGEPCIDVVLTPGENVLQFNNFPVVAEDDTTGTTDDTTDDAKDDTTDDDDTTGTTTGTTTGGTTTGGTTGGTTTGGTTTGGTTGGQAGGGTTGATVTDLPATGAGEPMNQVDYRVAWLGFASVVMLALGGYWVRQVATQTKRVNRD